jgi:hypothetical protein
VFLSGRVYMTNYVIRKIIFAQNGENLLRKTTGNKAHTIKIMMSALNITIWFVKPTKFFYNITITLFLSESVVQSLVK